VEILNSTLGKVLVCCEYCAGQGVINITQEQAADQRHQQNSLAPACHLYTLILEDTFIAHLGAMPGNNIKTLALP